MFGLAALEQAMLDLASDALDDCGLPVPAKQYRYHGDIAVQCCDGDGLLTVHWNPVTADRTGIPQGAGIIVGPRTAEIILRLYRCFPTLNGDGTFDDASGDAASAALAVDLDCLWTAFAAAICGKTLEENLAGCDTLVLLDVAPRKPAGGCAGLSFRFRAQWKPWSA